MPQLISIFLNVLTPVFALVLIGYWVTPRLDVDARTLTKISYYVLMPAFLFNIFSAAAIEMGLALRMISYIVSVSIACVLVGIGIAKILRLDARFTAAFALVAGFGNVGNFGLPIIQFKLGEEALVTASLYFLTLSVFGFVVGVWSATWYKQTGWRALLSVLKTPAILAVFPAILVNYFQWTTPLFMERTVDLLASAMIPTMLLTLGAQLAGMARPNLDRRVWLASSVRLIAGPILAGILAVPFGMTGITRGAGILQASMPTAILAVLVALEHDLVPDFVTSAVLISTLASAVTLTVVLALV